MITAAPKSTAFSSLSSTAIDDEENQKRNQQTQDYAGAGCCVETCDEPCGAMCYDFIQFW